MKKIFLILIVASVIMPLFAEETGIHRFATYNIRYSLKNNGDTGDKLWSNRAEYVYRIVRQYDFDVVGMQEVTGGSSQQLKDVETNMTEYTMYAVESAKGDQGYNAILYKTNRYNLIEQGVFYLNEHPETEGLGWTTNEQHPRLCIWTHLEDKATKQDFYFCCTHVNYGPTESGIESARLMARMIRDIAGQTPVILVGDFNMSRTEHELSYRNYMGEFYDSFLTTKTECIPTTNPSVEGTATNWETAGSGRFSGNAFDHIFYDHMECLNRYIITEDFGRSVTPSDHLPVMGRFRLQTGEHPTHFYANDEQSFRNAIEQATMKDTILLTAGNLSLSNNIVPQKSLCIIGGWNDDYTKIVGKTQLVPEFSEMPIFSIPHYWSLELQNIRIDNAKYSGSTGGAAVYSNGSVLKLVNCTMIGCHSDKQGGAITATTHDLILDNCFFKGCKSKAGGAIYIGNYSQLRIKNCRFRGNEAPMGGAVLVVSGQKDIVSQCSFWENKSEKQGTFTVKTSATNYRNINFTNCSFVNNTLTANKGLATVTSEFGGSAIYVSVPKDINLVNIGLCSFIGNNTDFSGEKENIGGSAVMVMKGKMCFMDNLCLANNLKTSSASMYKDLLISEDVDLWKNSDNVTSDMSALGAWQNAIPNFIEGTIVGDRFNAVITNLGAYKLKSTSINGFNIQTLTSAKRTIEKMYGVDLNEDGNQTGSINYDMLMNTRAVQSCIGAMEYGGKTESEEPEETADNLENIVGKEVSVKAKKMFVDNHVVVIKDGHSYDMSGQLIR